MRTLRLVVASPGDVKSERSSVQRVAEELNRGIALERELHIQVIRWETDTYPGFHPLGPQGQVDETLRIADCDILVGIFWKRFGKPVADADSGTEHEIRVAAASWKATGRPHVMIYFSQKAGRPSSVEEADQWKKVKQFQDDLQREALLDLYSTPAEFERHLREHLVRWIIDNYPIIPRSEPRSAIPDDPPYHEYIADVDSLPYWKMEDAQTVTDQQLQILREKGWEIGGPRWEDVDSDLAGGSVYVVWRGPDGKYYRLCNWKPVEQGNVYLMRKLGSGSVGAPAMPGQYATTGTRRVFNLLGQPAEQPPTYDTEGRIIPPPRTDRRRGSRFDVSRYADQVATLAADHWNRSKEEADLREQAERVLERFHGDLDDIGAALERLTRAAVQVERDTGILNLFRPLVPRTGPDPMFQSSLTMATGLLGAHLYAGVELVVRKGGDARLWALYGVGGQSEPVPVLFGTVWEDTKQIALDSPEIDGTVDAMRQGLVAHLDAAIDRLLAEVERLRKRGVRVFRYTNPTNERLVARILADHEGLATDLFRDACFKAG